MTDVEGAKVHRSSVEHRLGRYAIARVSGIDPESRIGQLTDKQIEKLEQIARNPEAHGIPGWMLNRSRDPSTGRNLHLLGADLDLAVKEDIQTMMRTKSWKGIRHSLGLKVRGQRTRTTGRSGMTVGVSRKAAAQAQAKPEEKTA
ncbi:MAG: 30S ribosomal protein S13 [Candidatus Caldarchaeum sp.]